MVLVCTERDEILLFKKKKNESHHVLPGEMSCVLTQGSRRMTFPCQRWLAHSEDDGEILRELVPSIVVLEVLNDDGEVLVTENAFEDPLQSRLLHIGDVIQACHLGNFQFSYF